MSENPDEPAEGDRGPSSTRSRALLAAGVATVGVVGLLFGLGVADLTGSNGGQAAAPPSASVAPTVAAPGSVAPPSSSTAPPGTLAAASTSSSTAEVATTSSSSSTTRASSSSSSTSVPATSAQITNPTTTSPPATINVAFSQGSDGALTVPRNGSAIIQLTNTGGQQGQFSLSLPTPDYSLSQTTGTVAPGATITVTVREIRNKAHSSAINAVVSPGTRLTIVLRTV